jgi:histidinol phosphatase-like PHP family hydrolase
VTRSKTRRRAAFDDINARIAFLLRDMADIQPSREKGLGYKRASFAVFWLEEPVTSIWNGTALTRRIVGVGPSSTRVIAEVMALGESPSVEQAIDQAGQRAQVTTRRALRGNFFSRAAVHHILTDTTSPGPTLADYRGDLQMHSTWSDGSMSLAELAHACMARGYQFAAVTDHSFGLPIAGGMSMADAVRQHEAIDRLNAGVHGFHLFKGVEANIAADGSLDLSPEDRRLFDVVLIAPHSKLRPADDQTTRMVRAVEESGAHILAHPRGRQAGTRAGVVADWDRVFRTAATAGVAIEIDGDPARQDLDFELARRAADAGCLFALDSDAHSPRELAYAETALAHARLAGIPAERIVNCWKLDRFRGWLIDRVTPRR